MVEGYIETLSDKEILQELNGGPDNFVPGHYKIFVEEGKKRNLKFVYNEQDLANTVKPGQDTRPLFKKSEKKR
ncbi:MAG: hypothetical protein ABUK01_10475 [Leptospirales bacterium]